MPEIDSPELAHSLHLRGIDKEGTVSFANREILTHRARRSRDFDFHCLPINVAARLLGIVNTPENIPFVVARIDVPRQVDVDLSKSVVAKRDIGRIKLS